MRYPILVLALTCWTSATFAATAIFIYDPNDVRIDSEPVRMDYAWRYHVWDEKMNATIGYFSLEEEVALIRLRSEARRSSRFLEFRSDGNPKFSLVEAPPERANLRLSPHEVGRLVTIDYPRVIACCCWTWLDKDETEKWLVYQHSSGQDHEIAPIDPALRCTLERLLGQAQKPGKGLRIFKSFLRGGPLTEDNYKAVLQVAPEREPDDADDFVLQNLQPMATGRFAASSEHQTDMGRQPPPQYFPNRDDGTKEPLLRDPPNDDY